MTANTPWMTTQRLAQAAGAPTPYRNYSAGGTLMLPGSIPAQLTRAIAADGDIKLLIMDGGGNNVLIGARQCLNVGSSTNPDCHRVVQEAITVSEALMKTAADAGIRDVIYFYYPELPPSLFGGAAPSEMLNYSLPLAKASCEGANARTGGALTCHFIDTRPLFQGRPDFLGGDQLHPSAAGAQAIGTAIWDVMKQKCIGQAAASACCI
jgi:hypothetical protein